MTASFMLCKFFVKGDQGMTKKEKMQHFVFIIKGLEHYQTLPNIIPCNIILEAD